MKRAFSVLAAFLRVWFFMFFTYLISKLLCNLVLFGWIDIRRNALLEVLVVPLAQSMAFWLLVKTFRRPIVKEDLRAGQSIQE
jgi:hypothetical protein